MSEPTDLMSNLLTTVVKKEPKKRGPKPKTTDTEKYDYIHELLTKKNKKDEKDREKEIKKKAKKEEAAEAKKKPALDKSYKQKMMLYLGKKLRKDDPDYPAIHEQVEKNKEKRSELYESLFKPVATVISVVPIQKYKSPMDEVREITKLIWEEEEKEKKEKDRLKKMMEDDDEQDKMYVPMVSDPYPHDIITELVEKSNTGKGVKKRNTKKNKKISKKIKSRRNSKKRI